MIIHHHCKMLFAKCYAHFKLGNIKRCAFPIRKHGWIMSLIHMVLVLLTTGRTIKKSFKRRN